MAENKQNTTNKTADPYMDSMVLYQKVYDFLKYIYPVLAQFPKFEKFALQTQIKTAMFEMLKSIIRFKKTGTKSHIYNADVELQFLKTLIRLSYDLEYKAMSKHRYEVASRHLAEIGKITGGIIEAVKDGKWK
ncbi:diversity-generating retroelement protein Avd [Lactonifactor longoviformis]|uniref:diversity-generating retroelement protein Avd n=1 Tax=Clostridia TaxID=186801 RepID=UPI0036F381ED